jgi:uridylate kinase
MTKVISLGGSLVAPDSIDENFIDRFRTLILNFLNKESHRKIILVVGGGAPARIYQQACRKLNADVSNDSLDWVGIAATRLNAMLIKTVFGCEEAPGDIVDNPETGRFDKGRILVACGWKPGFSSDYDAVVLAKRFDGSAVINLSNIDYVYDDDPRRNKQARPLSNISWADFTALVGTVWQPGANYPFDPIAARLAAEAGLTVVVAKGSNLENLSNILEEKAYIGTTIR